MASGRRRWGAWAVAAALLAGSASAGEGPIGPCSPYRAADGDIPSEMPGCARHRRFAPGSLGDELEFRRGARDAGEDAPPQDEDAPVPRRGKRRPVR